MKTKKTSGENTRSLKLTVQELETKVAEYLAECERDNKPPFLVQFANKLGMSADSLRNLCEKPAYTRSYKKIKETGEQWFISKLANSEKVLANQMFLLKAMYGYRENSNLDITTGGKPLGVVLLPKRG